MHIIGKAWGSTSLLYKSPLMEVHSLIVLPNAFCSLHVHTLKNNSFYVWQGSVTIEVHKNTYDNVDVTLLNEDDFTTVVAGEWHKFIGGSNGARLIEIYHLEPLSEDIMRKDKGGPGITA